MSGVAKLLLAAALGLVLLAGCGPDEGPVAAGKSATVAAPSFHTRYGFPGPWSRKDATREDFDADSASCLARSNAARREPTDGDRNAVAYRSFLECMGARGWTRGLAPAPQRVGEAGGRAAATARP